MTRRGPLVVLVACWLSGVGRGGAQAPAVVPDTGSISGRIIVLGESSPVPVRRARVTLDGGAERQATDTDTDGRYRFAGLGPGSYLVTAEKPGYVTLQAGASKPFIRPAPIPLKQAESLTVNLALPRGAALEGRLLTGTSEAALPATVAAVRVTATVQGRRPTVVAQATTDDLGRFRIHSLPAGAYYLEASVDPSAASSAPASPGQRAQGPARTYYPGTTNVSDAQAVRVATGEDRSGLDFDLQQVPMSSLRIRVLDAAGNAPAVAGCRVQAVGGPVGVVRGMSVPSRPNVCLYPAVPPGEYWMMGAARSAQGGPAEFAVSRVTVSGEDIGEIVLRVERGAEIAGTVESDSGEAGPAPGRVRVVTHAMAFDLPSPDARTATPQNFAAVQVSADGRFVMASVFGPTVFRLAGLPAGWALSAVWLDDRDVTDVAADVTAAEKPRRLRMIVTDRTARLHGTVTTADGRPVPPDTRVLVFASDERRWDPPSRFVFVAIPGADGRFSLDGVLPGSYVVTTLDDLEDDSRHDAAVLRGLSGTGTRIALAAGDDVAVALKTGRAR